MLKGAPVSPKEMKQLGRRIGLLLGHPLSGALLEEKTAATGCATFSVGESFEVWVVDTEAIQDSLKNVDLHNVARQTARMHHQISIKSRSVGYARSTGGRGARLINALSFSDVGSRIDEAIDFLDRSWKQKGTARLLMIPNCRIVGLWLVSARDKQKSSVLVVSAPPSFPFNTKAIVKSATLLNRVRRLTDQAVEPIPGNA